MDDSTLERFDHINAVQYLTAIVAVFAKAKLLQPSDVDEFKMLLQQYQLSRSASGQQPLLTFLDGSKSSAFLVMCEILGRSVIVRNLLRYSLRPQFDRLEVAFVAMGRHFIEKSAQNFNRPFAIFFENDCESSTPFASVLLDIAHQCHQSINNLKNCRQILDSMVFVPSNPDSQAEQELCSNLRAALNFQSTASSGLPFASEISLLEELRASVLSLITSLEVFFEQIRRNGWDYSIPKAKLALESIRASILHLNVQGFTNSQDFSTWEARRIYLHQAIVQICSQIEELQVTLFDTLQTSPRERDARPLGLDTTMRRQVFTHLIESGQGPKVAHAAASGLVEYCFKNGISARAVLGAELRKINSSLTDDALATAQRTEELFAISQHAAAQKNTNAQSLEFLKKFFGTLAIFVAVMLLGSGCGLKGNPRSYLADPRPELPNSSETSATKEKEVEQGTNVDSTGNPVSKQRQD